MDFALILVAFIFGFAAARIGLPPLVGYLAAGFALHAFGYESNTAIETISDFGVLLLLFGIGLKLQLKTLRGPEVWGVTSAHMTLTTVAVAVMFLVLGVLGIPPAEDLTVAEALLIGFAFSFSSTVFAVKALEDRNEAAALSGRIAIGILIIQDIAAVMFLSFTADESPSLWAIPAVAALVVARPLFGWFLDQSGHGELQVLLGLSLAIGVGAGSFELVGLKPDLGALLVGLTLANHPKSHEFADRLLGFKDVLLVGFFLSIGLGGSPGPAEVLVAVVALLVLPVKGVAFLALLSRFRLRSRTTLHTALTLTNYSEFGLIVAAVAAEAELIDSNWVSAVAVAVALSFAVSAPVNSARYTLYRRWARWLGKLERQPIRPDDALVDPGPCRIMVFGLGRVGTGAYDELVERNGETVLGIDRSESTVVENKRAGRNAVRGDALDRDFWEGITLHHDVDLVVLAMNEHAANLEAARRIRSFLPQVRIAASARYADEVTELAAAGVDIARDLYGEAGQGLADDASDDLRGE